MSSIAEFQAEFRRVFVDDLGAIIMEKRVIPAFMLALNGTDALAGYPFSGMENGPRFCEFIRAYFPGEYGPHADELWLLRNLLSHELRWNVKLTLGDPRNHLKTSLSVECYHEALLSAADRCFRELDTDAHLQAKFFFQSSGSGTRCAARSADGSASPSAGRASYAGDMSDAGPCPQCGLAYKFNGAKCGHCKYPNRKPPGRNVRVTSHERTLGDGRRVQVHGHTRAKRRKW